MKRVIAGIGIVLWVGMVWTTFSFGQTPKDDKSAAQTSSPLTPSGGPVVIIGDTFEFDTAQKIATYTGNAKVVQGETNMFADKLVIYLGQSEGGFEKAIATGNVRIVYQEVTATGDQGTLYQAEQKLDLEGKASAWQGNNTITAHRLVAFFKEGMVLEGYSGTTAERATMTVYSQKKTLLPEKTPAPDKTPPPAKPATPEPKPGSPESLKEPDAGPTVIVSDTLKLDNPNQKATFTGNVVVTQGVTKINADDMSVYIRKTPDKGDSIEKIEVAGNVQVVKESITITGDKGSYSEVEQYARVEGTPSKKARAEDKTKNMILEAPVIEVFLATNTIKGIGPTRTIFGTSTPGPVGEATPTPTPTPRAKTKGPKAEIRRDDFPSVTVYPKK